MFGRFAVSDTGRVPSATPEFPYDIYSWSVGVNDTGACLSVAMATYLFDNK